MANLSSLGYKSVTTLSYDEGLQLILSIRENRRKIKPKPQTKTKSTTTKAKKEVVPNVSPEQAERLLEMLTNKLKLNEEN
jgi:hypothetical protein